MKGRLRFYRPRGLWTTPHARTNPDEFSTFQDVETDRGGFEARAGMVRLNKIADAVGILDADGSNDNVTFPDHAMLVPLGTVWTSEILFQTDTLGGYVLGRNSATACGIKIQHTSASSGSVIVTITDSAAATTTLTWTGIGTGVVCALQVVRNGASLTGWLNGTTQTGTMSATNALAAGGYKAFNDNAGNFMDGGIDNWRLWSIARSTQQDMYRRLLNPRNRHVMFAWVFNQGSQSDVIDQGIYNAHATSSGSPTWARTPLSLSAHINGLGYNVKKDGTRQLVISSVGRPYLATVT